LSDTQESTGGKFPTQDQVSAGGVAFRPGPAGPEVVVVRVPPQGRWQLPKGLVGADERPEDAAVREVGEEAGIRAELLAPIQVIEYWYVAPGRNWRVRFHKFVHFFLMAYRGGDVAGHDREVEEARWVPIAEAMDMLAFKNERAVVARASDMIAEMERS
jgi:8-oxo-dGTP pyrophosphatase MutT (NUDIX family)